MYGGLIADLKKNIAVDRWLGTELNDKSEE